MKIKPFITRKSDITPKSHVAAASAMPTPKNRGHKMRKDGLSPDDYKKGDRVLRWVIAVIVIIAGGFIIIASR